MIVFRRCLLIFSTLSILMVGCASTETSNTPRTAKEQMLLSNAVDQSLDKVDFTPLYDQNVYVEEKYLECVDKPYVVGAVRHRVMRAGGRLRDKPEDSDVVMELRSGGVGTDTTEAFLGTPEIALPGMLTVPEIRVVERKAQYGYSKIGMVLYDAKSREVLGDGGLSIAESDDSNWTMFGVGPFQRGSLRNDVNRARAVPPGMTRRRLPTTVAFDVRSEEADDATIQFASQTEGKEE